jgi:hypothetical protein
MVTAKKDAAFERALARRRALETEMKEIDLFLSLYEKFARVEGEDDAGADVVAVDASGAVTTFEIKHREPAKVDEVRGPRISQEEFEKLAVELLFGVGRPLVPKAFLDKLHEQGRRLGGTDEMRNLTTKLWRARAKLIKIPGAGYWPRNVPCPAVGYQPDAMDMIQTAELMKRGLEGQR